MEKMFDKKKYLFIFAVATALIMVMTLFVFRLGVADNGTLSERMGKIGMYMSSSGEYFSDSFAVSDTKISPEINSIFYELFKFAGKDKVIYVYFPALLYVIMVIAGAVLIESLAVYNSGSKINYIFSALFILIFLDTGYVTFLNTPYKEGALIAVLILAVALFWYSVSKSNIISAVGFCVFGAVAASVTPAVCVTVIMLSLSGIIYLMRNKAEKRQIISVIMAAAAILSVFAINTSDFDSYNSVMFGATVESPFSENGEVVRDKHSEEIVNYFSLSDYGKYAGVSKFDENAPKNFKADIKAGDVALFYLKNPSLFLKRMEKAANNATTIKTGYLGNFLSSSGKAGKQSSWFSLYSTVKKTVIPANLYILAGIMIIVCIISVIYVKKYSENTEDKFLGIIGFVSAITAMLQLPYALIMYGFSQINFNMLGFNFIFDLSLYLFIVIVIKLFKRKRDVLREKYGVNQ